MAVTNKADFFCLVKVFFLLNLFFSVCVQADTSWQTQASEQLAQRLKSNPGNLPELNKPELIVFYRERNYKPLWLDAKGRLNRAYDLLSVIMHAEDEGLEAADYYLEEIKKYWNAKAPGKSITLDLLLTAALYRYSNHVYSGRSDPRVLDVDWHIQNRMLDVRSLFADVTSKDSITQVLKELPPQHSGYQLLKKELRHFRDLKQQGGWLRFKTGPTLEIGMHHQQVKLLRQRLESTGDLIECALRDIDIFDHTLATAVKRYQLRHGLDADGRVGGQTRRSLNITVETRLRQIRLNMERWRWMQRQLENRYLVVNMTGFELYLMENASAVLTMPVIIGKSYRSTPSFSGQVSTMEYNPYWTVPTNITLQDLIPRQINDPAYFAKKSIKLYRGLGDNVREINPQTVDWEQVDKDHFPYWLRQDPGPENAMGRIKFLFSNPYEIYLHGTPDKHLFDRVIRTFSAGCIRVKDPVQLAAYLLNDGSLQMEEEVLANIYLGSNQKVTLPAAIPIYLVYLTAWVDQDGNMNFRQDIYNRDTRLNNLFGI